MSRRTAHQRGYDHRWRKESKAYLARNPWCVIRGEGCTLIATLVDHIAPHRGDMILFWNPDNWQSSCVHCHSMHKQIEESKGPERDHRGRLIL
jgi:5-methylcytosine-specific restriction endonuclease McrA